MGNMTETFPDNTIVVWILEFVFGRRNVKKLNENLDKKVGGER